MSVPAGEKTLIDAATGAPFPAVPAPTLLGSSRTLAWRGILVARADAKATYAARLQAGDEAFRKGMDRQFFG